MSCFVVVKKKDSTEDSVFRGSEIEQAKLRAQEIKGYVDEHGKVIADYRIDVPILENEEVMS